MNIVNLILVMAIVASIIHHLLFFIVKNFLIEGTDWDINWPLWAFQKSKFDETGKIICNIGIATYFLGYGGIAYYLLVKVI